MGLPPSLVTPSTRAPSFAFVNRGVTTGGLGAWEDWDGGIGELRFRLGMIQHDIAGKSAEAPDPPTTCASRVQEVRVNLPSLFDFLVFTSSAACHETGVESCGLWVLCSSEACCYAPEVGGFQSVELIPLPCLAGVQTNKVWESGLMDLHSVVRSLMFLIRARSPDRGRDRYRAAGGRPVSHPCWSGTYRRVVIRKMHFGPGKTRFFASTPRSPSKSRRENLGLGHPSSGSNASSDLATNTPFLLWAS